MQMNALQTITANAFRLPSMATANEDHIARAIRGHEIADGHRKFLPSAPDKAEIKRDAVLRDAERSVLAYMLTCEDYTTTQRTLTQAMCKTLGPSAVQNAIRNMWGKQLIAKHSTSTGNRNWYQLTAEALEL